MQMKRNKQFQGSKLWAAALATMQQELGGKNDSLDS